MDKPQKADASNRTESISALRQGEQKHIGWSHNSHAFIRETGGETLLIVYNNAASAQDIQMPVGDTSLESRRELNPLFGSANAVLIDQTLQVTLPAMTMAVYSMR